MGLAYHDTSILECCHHKVRDLLCCCSVAKSRVTLVIACSVAGQASLSTGLPRQETLECVAISLPDPGIKPSSPTLQVDSLPLGHQGSP